MNGQPVKITSKEVTPSDRFEQLVAINDTDVLTDTVVVKIALPRAVFEQYEALALSQELDTHELLSHRLARCADHGSIRPIYLSDSQRSQLERLLQKRPIETGEQALALITTAMSVKVGDFPPVPITAAQAKRIITGVIRGQSPYERLCMIVERAVTAAVGI